MKKSLNNRLRGKRLVTGDENEVTSNEILIEDKDGKVAVKQRGAEGKMEDISEGSGFDILYYCYGSINGATITDFLQCKSAKGILEFLQCNEDLENIPTAVLFNELYYKVLDIAKFINNYNKEDNITIDENNSMDDCGIININISSPVKGVYGMLPELHVGIPLLLMNNTTDKSLMYVKSYYSNQNEGLNSLNLRIAAPVIYDATNNVLLYYSADSSMNIHISPASLADTLKLYRMNESLKHIAKTTVNGEEYMEKEISNNPKFIR